MRQFQLSIPLLASKHSYDIAAALLQHHYGTVLALLLQRKPLVLGFMVGRVKLHRCEAALASQALSGLTACCLIQLHITKAHMKRCVQCKEVTHLQEAVEAQLQW